MYPYDPNTPPAGDQPPVASRKRHPIRNILGILGTLALALIVVAIIDAALSHTPSGSTAATPPQSASAPATQSAVPAVSATAAPARASAPAYRALTSRTWAQIAKDPDAHAGETYVVYGEVTQFDAATGQSQFRADAGGVRQYPDEAGFVNYPVNTILDGDAATLSPVVEKDLFTAKVTVTGSLSYDTQIGGSTTVPELHVDSITVTGHAGS